MQEGHVFYNPVQEVTLLFLTDETVVISFQFQFNRDISICVLNTFLDIYRSEVEAKNAKKETPKPARKVRILEALSATGLRSIRYAKEVPGIDEVIANDLMAEAVEMIKKNVLVNEVGNIVTPNQADAM